MVPRQPKSAAFDDNATTLGTRSQEATIEDVYLKSSVTCGNVRKSGNLLRQLLSPITKAANEKYAVASAYVACAYQCFVCVTTKQRLDLTSKTLGCVILLEKGLLFEVLYELN